MRWLILGIIAGLATAGLVAWLTVPPPPQAQEQRFLQWETCVLNDQPHCGPQPVP